MSLKAEDIKPRGLAVQVAKPKMDSGKVGGEDQLYEQVLLAGMWMASSGITYPETITVKSRFSP